MVDRELAQAHREVAMVTTTKSIILEPCVVQIGRASCRERV